MAVPTMFLTMQKVAERYAIGINSTTGLPAHGRLMQLFNMYADDQHSFNRDAFKRLLRTEFRAIPKNACSSLWIFVTNVSDVVSVKRLVNLLLTPDFGKEKSILDFPFTFANAANKTESLDEAIEKIRLEMIEHLRLKRMSVQDYFFSMDRDGNGVVDTGELMSSLRHNNLGIGRFHACTHLLKRCAQSNRGGLTFSEFKSMLVLDSPKAQRKLALLNRRLPTDPVAGIIQRKAKAASDRNARQHGRFNLPKGFVSHRNAGKKIRKKIRSRSAKTRRPVDRNPYRTRGHSSLLTPFNNNFEMHRNSWGLS